MITWVRKGKESLQTWVELTKVFCRLIHIEMKTLTSSSRKMTLVPKSLTLWMSKRETFSARLRVRYKRNASLSSREWTPSTMPKVKPDSETALCHLRLRMLKTTIQPAKPSLGKQDLCRETIAQWCRTRSPNFYQTWNRVKCNSSHLSKM